MCKWRNTNASILSTNNCLSTNILIFLRLCHTNLRVNNQIWHYFSNLLTLSFLKFITFIFLRQTWIRKHETNKWNIVSLSFLHTSTILNQYFFLTNFIVIGINLVTTLQIKFLSFDIIFKSQLFLFKPSMYHYPLWSPLYMNLYKRCSLDLAI